MYVQLSSRSSGQSLRLPNSPQRVVSQAECKDQKGDQKTDQKGNVKKEERQPPILRPEAYYEYRLVGILVHSGSANGGHYYSYIKERSPAAGKLSL